MKTGAQAVLLALGAAEGFSLFDLDPVRAIGAFLGGFLISALTSLVSAPFGPEGSPSLVVDTSDSVHPDAV